MFVTAMQPPPRSALSLVSITGSCARTAVPAVHMGPRTLPRSILSGSCPALHSRAVFGILGARGPRARRRRRARRGGPRREGFLASDGGGARGGVLADDGVGVRAGANPSW